MPDETEPHGGDESVEGGADEGGTAVEGGADEGGTDAVERLKEHLDDVSDRSDAMEERLEELGEGIEAARQQAEGDNLLPDEEGSEGGDAAWGELGLPEGDERRETPLDDADFEAGG